MCKVARCHGKVLARGLCAKHYMRQRRSGDPNKTGQRGRPRSEYLTFMRSMFPNMSARTLSRYAEAMRLLGSKKSKKAAIKSATRPNGTISVAKLLRIAAAGR